jgi:hypothetical protein
VVPNVVSANPLLAHLYTSGKERNVFAVTVVASLLGTAAVIGGQVSLGVSGAAAGYVLRQVLFTLTLAGIALVLHSRAARADALDARAAPLLVDPEDAPSSPSS